MKQPKTATKEQNAPPANEPEVATPELTPEQIGELKSRAEKADQNWDRYLRAAADLENYKKRATRERLDAIKFANESLLQQLILVVDNVDMALAATQSGQANTPESLQAGISMIYQQLKKVLADAGLEEVDAMGKTFDPNLHEAVSQQETGDMPEGQVLQQLRKGYKLRERLIRPASVVVARKPVE